MLGLDVAKKAQPEAFGGETFLRKGCSSTESPDSRKIPESTEQHDSWALLTRCVCTVQNRSRDRRTTARFSGWSSQAPERKCNFWPPSTVGQCLVVACAAVGRSKFNATVKPPHEAQCAAEMSSELQEYAYARQVLLAKISNSTTLAKGRADLPPCWDCERFIMKQNADTRAYAREHKIGC